MTDPIRPAVSFKLAVLAASKQKADEYVQRQAIGCRWHRQLKYVGEGMPDKPETWCAATVRERG